MSVGLRKKFVHASSNSWDYECGCYLCQRFEDEAPAVHQRVWNCQLWQVYLAVVIEKYVYVYCAVVIFAVDGLGCSAKFFFYILCGLEYLHGFQHC